MVEDEEVNKNEELMVGINFAAYKDATLFQNSVITFMARLKTNKDDLSVIRRIFSNIDRDHDGFLQTNEIGEAWD